MPNKRTTSQALQPSEFDNKIKLNVIVDRSRTLLHPGEVLGKLTVGHPDAIATGSADSTCIPFAFQSVYAEQDSGRTEWRPCFRYLAQSVACIHRGFFRTDIHLSCKFLYEISFKDRAKNLYFDLEQPRSSSSSMTAEEQDRECWVKVQVLQSMVTDVFRYAATHLFVLIAFTTATMEASCVMACRQTYTDLSPVMHFFAAKGYDWSGYDRGVTNISPCKLKFSCHLIVKHETHMFPSLQELTEFIDLLRGHKDWDRCSDIIDLNVYHATQLFCVPFAVKAPKFDPVKKSFDTTTPQNVLLPVDPKSGVLVLPELSTSRLQVKLALGRWKSYLLTTPFKFDRIALPLKIMIRLPFLSRSKTWNVNGDLTLVSLQSQERP